MSTTTRFLPIASALLLSVISTVAMANEEVKTPRLVTCATPTYEEKSILKDEEGIANLYNSLITALAENQKASAYLIKTGNNSLIIVFTTQAEPWAQLKMTSLQHTLMKINFNL